MYWWITLNCICLCNAETWHNYNGKSYYVSPESHTRNHSSARSACEARSSMLAVITNREDSDFIADITRRLETYFIGLTGPDDCEPPASEACRERWEWIDGTISDFSDWAKERPLAERGCGVFKGDASLGAWDAVHYRSVKKYICQHNCQPDECYKSDCNFDNGIYKCTCEPDYTGIHCATKIDDCASRPCEHGATCNDGINSYTCYCLPGYIGIDCETDINECSSSPCNKGTCDDQINSFECNCNDGFNGTLCNYNIDECSSNPCSNGGTCEDQINGYECQCVNDTNFDENCDANIEENSRQNVSNENQQIDMGVVVALSVLLSLVAVAFLITLVIAIWIFRKYRKLQKRSNRPTNQTQTDNDNYCKLQMQSNPVSTNEIYYNIK